MLEFRVMRLALTAMPVVTSNAIAVTFIASATAKAVGAQSSLTESSSILAVA